MNAFFSPGSYEPPKTTKVKAVWKVRKKEYGVWNKVGLEGKISRREAVDQVNGYFLLIFSTFILSLRLLISLLYILMLCFQRDYFSLKEIQEGIKGNSGKRRYQVNEGKSSGRSCLFFVLLAAEGKRLDFHWEDSYTNQL